jgi:hypothetical protein
MVTTTSGVNAFDKRYYQAVAEQAAKYHRENYNGILNGIPMKKIEWNKDEYKKPIFGESTGVYGGKPSLDAEQMLTAKSHKVWRLKNVNGKLVYDEDDMMKLGEKLAQERQEQIAEWTRQANMSLFHGVYTKGYDGRTPQGVALNDGFITNAQSVTNLNGTDSQLDASGDIYASLTKFVETIPYRYMENAQVNLLMDPLFFRKANSSTFTNDSGVTEWEQFIRFYRSDASPYRIGNVYFSNDLVLDSGDTVGTNSRLFGWVSSPNVVERVYSRGFQMMGEFKNHIGGVTQTWTTKLEGCVHDNNGVIYSDKITY